MSTDFIPSSDNDMVNLLQNLGTRLAPLAVSLGLTAADATAVTTDATSLRTVVLDQEDKRNAAKSATAAKLASRLAVDKRTRALAKRIKASPGYTAAIGEQLGIVGRSSAGGSMLQAANKVSLDDQPRLTVSVTGDGTVRIKFAKQGHTGIFLYGRRGDASWTLLAKQLRSPYVDTRANGAGDAPETREYRAQFFEGDTAVGQMSATFSVTVPGIGTVADEAAPSVTALAKAA